ELGCVQRTALAVTEDTGEIDDLLLTRRKQLLHGEFGRGTEVAAPARAIGTDEFGGEGVEVGLVSRRYLHSRRLDLDKPLPGEPGAELRHDARARQKEPAAVAVAVTVPERRRRHLSSPLAA